MKGLVAVLFALMAVLAAMVCAVIQVLIALWPWALAGLAAWVLVRLLRVIAHDHPADDDDRLIQLWCGPPEEQLIEEPVGRSHLHLVQGGRA